MNELTLPISDLKAKIEKLVTLHQQLKKENEQLIAENKELAQKLEEEKQTVLTALNKNQELLQHKDDQQNKIVTDTKVKINELVQEIDNCIALLK